jgi:DNA-binding GntR family transcriptional regulator
MPNTAKGSGATAVQLVVDAVVDGIKTGRYAPGQRLVEVDLTTDLGVSRGPLREALGRLAAEGVLDIEPYRGAVVRRLGRDDVVDLFRIRELLEGEAARLAATRIDEPGHRRRLERAITAIDRYRQRGDAIAYMDENSRFHEVLVDLSGNKLLARLIGQLQVHAFRLLIRRLVDEAAVTDSITEHDQVAKAVLAGDARAAERAMRNHVRRSGEMVLRAGERTDAF